MARSEINRVLLVGQSCGALPSEWLSSFKVHVVDRRLLCGEPPDLPDHDAILVDARSPAHARRGEDLAGTLERLRTIEPERAPVVLVSDDPGAAAEAVAAGSHMVVTESATPDEIDCLLRAAAEPSAPGRTKPREGDEERRADTTPLEPPVATILGTSAAMRRVQHLLCRVAATDVPVLLQGESGTGKDLAARAIHASSPRAGGPFVAINCAAIPANLLESELFGHERGAFSGAARTKPGRFELADRGTLFLDEVGELAPELQVKLLRFLEDHVLERLGGRRSIRVDVRMLAATNVDLWRAVESGAFRRDLYYRIAVFPIVLPPLRERGEDALEIARRVLEEEGRGRFQGLDRSAERAILSADWPGNVRELANRVRRATVVAEGPRIRAADLGLDSCAARIETLREARLRTERETLVGALKTTGGNRRSAAHLLGVSRARFYELLHRHDLIAPH